MNFNDLKEKALNRKQMRAIKGGSGTCEAKSPTGEIICDVSKKEALFWATDSGSWCCENCKYCGK